MAQRRNIRMNLLVVNSRLDEIQAAFLNVKLPILNEDNSKRRESLQNDIFQKLKNNKITLPYWDFSTNHVFHLFVIRTEDRNKFTRVSERK